VNILLLASAVVPTVLLMWLFLTSDEFPEPRSVLLVSFTLGGFLGPFILVVAHALEPYTSEVVFTNPVAAGVSSAFFGAAIPEEILKFLVLLLYAIPHQEFDEPMDGVVYGVTISLGFATVENIYYVFGHGYGTALARGVTAVPCHATLGAIMGYYAGRGVFSKFHRFPFFVRSLGLPILLHGLYDSGPLIWKNAEMMGVTLPRWSEFLLAFIFIVVMGVMVSIAARATGMLRSRQLRVGRPQFFFESMKELPPEAFSLPASPRVEYQPVELKVIQPSGSFTKVLAILCTCSSFGCMGGLLALFLLGKAGTLEVFFLGVLSLLLGVYAVRHLTNMNATISTDLEHHQSFVHDLGKNGS